MMGTAKVRVDKWLWSVRIFKSRTLATEYCRSGRIKVNQLPAKASTDIRAGDIVMVKKGGFQFTFKVIEPIEKRVGAPIAARCYENCTPQDEMFKYEAWFVASQTGEFRDKGAGRPTKKERRDMDEFKDGFFWFDEDE